VICGCSSTTGTLARLLWQQKLILVLGRDAKVRLVAAEIDKETRQGHKLGHDPVAHHPVTIDRIAFGEVMDAGKQKVGRDAAPHGQQRSFLKLPARIITSTGFVLALSK
jgi:hypothetical protein